MAPPIRSANQRRQQEESRHVYSWMLTAQPCGTNGHQLQLTADPRHPKLEDGHGKKIHHFSFCLPFCSWISFKRMARGQRRAAVLPSIIAISRAHRLINGSTLKILQRSVWPQINEALNQSRWLLRDSEETGPSRTIIHSLTFLIFLYGQQETEKPRERRTGDAGAGFSSLVLPFDSRSRSLQETHCSAPSNPADNGEYDHFALRDSRFRKLWSEFSFLIFFFPSFRFRIVCASRSSLKNENGCV